MPEGLDEITKVVYEMYTKVKLVESLIEVSCCVDCVGVVLLFAWSVSLALFDDIEQVKDVPLLTTPLQGGSRGQ